MERVRRGGRMAEADVRRARAEVVIASGVAVLGALVLVRRQRHVEPVAQRGPLSARESNFSAVVAHELRTPLTRLRLRVERLAAADRPPDEIAAVLEEDVRLEAAVEHLVAESRRAPTRSTLDTSAILASLVDRWAERMQRAARRLVVDPASSGGEVGGSASSVSRALDVLVDNALRHGAGDIRVRCRLVAGGAVIEVADDGPGITPGVDVFAHPDERGGSVGRARGDVEAQGGRLLLVSSSPACFHLVLPDAVS